jgi:hypothetical protein
MPKSFGPTPKQKEREENENMALRVWESIECEFDVLKRQHKSGHRQELATLLRLIWELEMYRDSYIAAKGITLGKEQN